MNSKLLLSTFLLDFIIQFVFLIGQTIQFTGYVELGTWIMNFTGPNINLMILLFFYLDVQIFDCILKSSGFIKKNNMFISIFTIIGSLVISTSIFADYWSFNINSSNGFDSHKDSFSIMVNQFATIVTLGVASLAVIFDQILNIFVIYILQKRSGELTKSKRMLASRLKVLTLISFLIDFAAGLSFLLSSVTVDPEYHSCLVFVYTTTIEIHTFNVVLLLNTISQFFSNEETII